MPNENQHLAYEYHFPTHRIRRKTPPLTPTTNYHNTTKLTVLITCECLFSTALIPAKNEFEPRGDYAFRPFKSSGSTETILEEMATLLNNSYFAITLLLQYTNLYFSSTQGKETTVPKVAIYYTPFFFYKSSYYHCHSVLLELVGRKSHVGTDNVNIIPILSRQYGF